MSKMDFESMSTDEIVSYGYSKRMERLHSIAKSIFTQSLSRVIMGEFTAEPSCAKHRPIDYDTDCMNSFSVGIANYIYDQVLIGAIDVEDMLDICKIIYTIIDPEKRLSGNERDKEVFLLNGEYKPILEKESMKAAQEKNKEAMEAAISAIKSAGPLHTMAQKEFDDTIRAMEDPVY